MPVIFEPKSLASTPTPASAAAATSTFFMSRS
jgi:hypothetical protein